MAILGFQLVVSMIVASFLHKLTPYYSFGKWYLAHRLVRFLPPSDDCLRPHVIIKTGKVSRNSTGTAGEIPPDSLVKKNAKILLRCISLNDLDMIHLSFYSELKWFLDLFAATLFVCVSTLLYYCYNPVVQVKEINIAVMWIGVLFCYVTKQLISLTRVYVSLLQERWTCLLLSVFLLVCALIVLLMDEDILEFELNYSYGEIFKSLNCIASQMPSLSLSHIFPPWLFKVGLAVLSSLLGTLFVLPSIHYAWMQFEVMSSKNQSVLLRAALKLTYFLPVLCASLWIKPAARLVLTSSYSLTDEGFDLLRICIILCYCLLRFCFFSIYLQAHFNKAKKCVMCLSESRVTVGELRNQISNPFTIYGCVALKYTAPVILLCISVVLLFFSSNCCSLFDNSSDGKGNYGSLLLTTRQIPLVQLSVYRGVFSFLCWWINFSIFISGLLGALLQQMLSI